MAETGRDRETERWVERERKKDKIFHSYIINSLHCHGGLVKLIFFLLPMTDLMSSPTLAAEYTNENLSNFDLAA